jgi:hypothetical protein
MMVIALVTVLIAGCQAQMPPTHIICGACEEQDRMVRVQPVYNQDGRETFAHPFLLSIQDWKVILKSVYVQKEGVPFLIIKDSAKPAFSEDEIDYLSTIFNRVFAQLGPHERVIFALSRRRSTEIVELTSGGWFVNGPSIYFTLAHYRYAVTMSNIKERIWQDPLRPVSPSSYALVPREHQAIVGDGSGAGFLSPKPTALSIAYKPLLLGEPQFSVPSETGTSGFIPSPNETRLSIEERLQTLKRLRDQALITEEEYQVKKRQILDEF